MGNAAHTIQEPLTGDILASKATQAIDAGLKPEGRFAKMMNSEQALQALAVVKEKAGQAGGALAIAGRTGIKLARRYPARSLLLGVGIGIAVFLIARSVGKTVDTAFDEAATA